jgi:predicted HicB family RNase H-like nuclease
MKNQDNVIELSPERLNERASPFPIESNASSKRMTIQFSPELYEHLQSIADAQGISLAEAVRKSVALESYLRQALKRSGARLLIEDEKSVKELILR